MRQQGQVSPQEGRGSGAHPVEGMRGAVISGRVPLQCILQGFYVRARCASLIEGAGHGGMQGRDVEMSMYVGVEEGYIAEPDDPFRGFLEGGEIDPVNDARQSVPAASA